MKVIRSLYGSGSPPVLELPYNGEDDADATELRYRGSLVKLTDVDNSAGVFLTGANETTALENIFGILEEEQGTSGNYLPGDASYGMQRRKITPLLPGMIIEAEYARTDRAGTANTDTNVTGTSGANTLTAGDSITLAPPLIGGWVFFINGANANYLYYISAADTSAETLTTATALKGTVAATDDFLFIQPANDYLFAIDATYTGLISDIDTGNRSMACQGIDHYVQGTNLAKTKLDRDVHDGLYIPGAKFWHQMAFIGTATLPSVWTAGALTT